MGPLEWGTILGRIVIAGIFGGLVVLIVALARRGLQLAWRALKNRVDP